MDSRIEDIINENKERDNNAYRMSVRLMSDEELGYEFADRIGDEYDEFKTIMYHYGRKFIEEMLIDNYEVDL